MGFCAFTGLVNDKPRVARIFLGISVLFIKPINEEDPGPEERTITSIAV
jgi:hypothetical protein